MTNKHILLLIAVVFIAACDKKEDIPAYVRVEPIEVDEPGGAAFHEFPDAWFYAGGAFLGAYTLPAEIPVLAEGSQEIQIFAGVKENGSLATPNFYPFMQRYVEVTTLAPAGVTVVRPRVKYDPAALFAWSIDKGNFDQDPTVAVENYDTDQGLDYSFDTTDPFSGRYLKMQVDTTHPLMTIAFESTTLPTQLERQTWLEMHYRCNTPFTVNLLGITSGQEAVIIPVFIFNTSENWNKIYINLTEFIGFNVHDQYRLLISLSLYTDSPDLKGRVDLDNVRIVHF